MSTTKGFSQKSIPSKVKISTEVSISKSKQNDSLTNARINESGSSKLDKKGNKVKGDKQDLATVIFQKEKAITKLQKQLDREKKDYEKIRTKVEQNLHQQSLTGKPKLSKPQTASSVNSKRDQNSSAKYLEEIRSQKQRNQKINGDYDSQGSQQHVKLSKTKLENEKGKHYSEDGGCQNKSMTLTDYEQARETQQLFKGLNSNNFYGGHSPFNTGYKSKEWDEHQSSLKQKTKDISQINFTPTENRSHFTSASGVKLSANPYSFSQNRYNSLSANTNSNPIMQNKTIQQAMTIQNQKTIDELQGRLDQILKSGDQYSLQTEELVNNGVYNSHDRFKYRSQEGNQSEQADEFRSLERTKLFQDEHGESLEAPQSKTSQERFNSNSRNQYQTSNSVDKRITTQSEFPLQQFSTQSFGIQQKNSQNYQNRMQYELPPQFQESMSHKFRSDYIPQSEPTSIKNGKKKIIDSEIQLYQLQKEKHENEIQQLRLQVKVLEKELKDKKQETLQKEIEYKTELGNIQTVLASIEKENKISELREQETKVLMQQLHIKESEINEMRVFYEDKLQSEQQQFSSQKKIWQKIYHELQEEINILKHELNQYNVQIINEQIPTKHADVKYINFVERYN